MNNKERLDELKKELEIARKECNIAYEKANALNKEVELTINAIIGGKK